ncbi:MAG TPA: hypothetical protein PLD54_01390 [Candidatus Levybacteria bacterium]|nr:hypothetical protein [Candidatus Levybacteria bacterium]
MEEKTHGTVTQPDPPQSPTPPASPLPQIIYPSPRHLPKKMLIIAGIIVLLLISGLAGFAFFNQKAVSDKVVPPTPPTTTPTATDLTANWKTYRNEEYGFSFSYPMRYHNIREENNKIYLGEGGIPEIVITTNRNDFNSEYTQIRPCAVVPYPTMPSDEGECLTDAPGTNNGILITQIDNVPAIRFTIHHMFPGLKTTIVQTTQSPDIEIIKYYADTGPHDIDHILPTFKFIENINPLQRP